MTGMIARKGAALSSLFRSAVTAGACAAVLAMVGAPHLAQAAAAASAGNPRMNGYWNVDAAYRAKSNAESRAELTPAAQAIARENARRAQERLDRGDPVGLGSYICGVQPVPFVTGTSEPWLLVVTDEEVSQIFERRQMLPRHFYMGRDWPDLSNLPALRNGYSLGRWEGQDLVVETRGLPATGGGQGGVVRSAKTTLTERLRLSEDGQSLFWTYTWADPDMLVKPLDFTLKYDRAPPHTFAYTHPCDPNEGAARTVSAEEE